jgi:hypothetical protein
VILVSDINETFVYSGTNIAGGRKYTYNELKKYLASKCTNSNLSILIKPLAGNTMKSTAEMLELMTRTNIKKYALADISKEEEDYFNQLR